MVLLAFVGGSPVPRYPGIGLAATRVRPNWELIVTFCSQAVMGIGGAASGERVVWQIGVRVGVSEMEHAETSDDFRGRAALERTVDFGEKSPLDDQVV